MRKGADLFRIICALAALAALPPQATRAAGAAAAEETLRQDGEDRWVPSLAVTSGVSIQNQDGFADSVLFEDMNPVSIDRRGFVDGNDVAVSPFVGGALEVMSPALPIPTRPRFFASAEILPTFASSREIAIEGDPGCVRGPEPDAPCARDETAVRFRQFGENEANGQGSKTSSRVSTVVFGANVGVAFPLQVRDRALRIKPSFSWINYEVESKGLVVYAVCVPITRCTDVAGFPPSFLRETMLTANDSRRFNAIGPGLDIEMDTGHYGPLGVSLFLGGRAYAVLGERAISFGTTETYDDLAGMDTAVARFEVEVDPWIYRAHVGIRFHWLGFEP